MPAMSLQSDLDALNTAIRLGVRSVTNGEQTVTYNTTASLIAARDDLVKQINAEAEAATPRRRHTYAYQSGRGYEQ